MVGTVGDEKPKPCRWWRPHNWGKWQNGMAEYESHFSGKTFTVQKQVRICETCGKMELRDL